MKPFRLPRCRVLAVACVLVVAGLSQAAAQFPPAPGQANPGARQSAVFPPPPGQSAGPQEGVFPPPPGQAAAPGGFSAAPPGGGGFSAAPPGGGFGGPPSGPNEAQKICLTFPAIREDVEKSANAIKAAGERKAPREEVCPMFKSFAAKEAKLVGFLERNQKLCGVPPKIVAQMKTNHTTTIRIRNNVCSTGPAGPAAGPSLSDALGGPIIADDTSTKLPGRGTFDTLTGSALAR
jgi:hypothetical protein